MDNTSASSCVNPQRATPETMLRAGAKLCDCYAFAVLAENALIEAGLHDDSVTSETPTRPVKHFCETL